MDRRGKTSGDDKREGAMDKAKGRLKEAAGSWAETKSGNPRVVRTSARVP